MFMRSCLLFCCLFITGLNVTAQPAFVKDSLSRYIQRALADWQVPGVAVGIVKNGNLVVAKGYGLREWGKPDLVDAATLFMIGSNTKAFTGTALALLEHEGKCKLTDPVKKYLPQFSMKDPWLTEHVNLQDIVSHRMGLETFQGDFMYWTSNLTSDQVIEKFGKLEPLYAFRTKWGYTNAGFVVAGKVIENLSGQSWAAYLQQRIFQPLGMYRTLALSTELPQASNRASAHTLVDGVLTAIPYADIDNLAPAGSISSSIIDMSHWVGALLEGGRYAGKEILPPAVISRTREPLSIEGRRASTSWGVRRHYALYGMGWELSDYDGRELVSHTGGVNGFVTAVTLVPEENLGIIVLTNTDQNGLYVALMRQILDAYLGLPYHDYSGSILKNFKQGQAAEADQYQAFKDTIAANPATALPLKAYAGNYRNDVYGRMTINVTGNYLEAAFEHHPNLRGKLEPLGGHRFLMSFSDPIFGRKPVAFAGNGKKIERFTLQLADFVEFTTYDFVRVED